MSFGVGPQQRVPRHVPSLPATGPPGDFIYDDSSSSSYIADNAGNYQILDTGSGDIGGGVGSTDNAVPRADGTGGKTIQASGVIIDDSNNLTASNLAAGFATTATAAATTTLTIASKGIQEFTGSTTQTIKLPVVTTLPQTGFQFVVINRSSGIVTVQSSGANTIQAMAATTTAIFTCVALTGTGAASWDVTYIGATGIAGSTGATDNAVLRADGAGGATLQNSALIVSDAGAMFLGDQAGVGLSFGDFTLPFIYAPNGEFYLGSSAVSNTNIRGTAVNFTTTAGASWSMSVAGHLLAGTDNTFDIGASGATRPRSLYLATGLAIEATITAAATVGAQTINKTAGSVNFAATASSLVVTCDKCTTSSIVMATVATNDTTLKSVQAVAANGSFTLFGNAAAAAETRVNFWILTPD